jgi:proline iminopeptidase
MGRSALYPRIEPFATGLLAVSNLHSIYFEQCGNPSGHPVLFLHGGPGSCIAPVHRRFFDPAHYRLVLFDQRGCGQSRPLGSIMANTTQDLVGDIEKLRISLGIERWTLFGGSWGSALALYYAIHHRDRVCGLILRGVFFVSARELHWFYQDGAGRIFPEEFERFKAVVPAGERESMIAAYNRLLNSPNSPHIETAAMAWCRWEAAASFLVPRKRHVAKFSDPAISVPYAKIESHYFANLGFFSGDNEILNRVQILRHVPICIVQGRYDLVCPMESAWLLHQALPESELVIVDEAGHSALDNPITKRLVAAANDFKLTS